MTERHGGTIDVVLDELAHRSLNAVPAYEPASVAEAIDELGRWVRVGSLALALALLDVARAMRERSDS